MTRKHAKEKGYTHTGLTYKFIPIYLANTDNWGVDIVGKNWFWNSVLSVFLWVDEMFYISVDGYKIWEGEEL